MNKVILLGRLTADPEIRYTQGNEPLCVASYSLAVDRPGKHEQGQQTADFLKCTAFGKRGEFAQKYLHKGSKIAVLGHLQTGSYTHKDTGIKIYTTDVIVESQEFAESKAESQNRTQDSEGFVNIPDQLDENLPFH